MGGFRQGFFGGLAQGESVPGAVFEGLAARKQRQQDLTDEQREKRNTEFDTAIEGLQKKYAAALKTDEKGNTIETPASLQAKYALTQALQARDAFKNPLKKPGIGQKIEEALRIKKKPQAPSVTTQTGGITIPAATAAPTPLPAEPASQQLNLQPATGAAGQGAPAQNEPATPGAKPMHTPAEKAEIDQLIKGGFNLDPSKQPGLLTPGNINLDNRPIHKNADGSISTLHSTSVGIDGKEVLIPLVSDDGRMMTLKEAIDTYKRTGKHLGIFDSPAHATAYAKNLWARQELKYGRGGTPQTGAPAPRLSKGPVEPSRPATTLPGLETPAVPVFPGKPLTVTGQAQTPKQLREQAQRNQQAQQEMELLTAGAEAPVNQYAARRKELIEAGFSKEDADKAVRILAGLEAKPVAAKEAPEKYFSQLTTTKDAQGKEHYWRVPMSPGDNPEEVDFNGQTIAPKPAKPSTAWKNEYAAAYARGHGITPEQLTPADMNFIDQQIALSSSAPSTTVTNTLKQDANGFWVPIQESNRRIPGFGVILGDPRGRASGKVKVPTKDPEPAAETAPTAAELPPATVGGAVPAAPPTVPTTPGAAKNLAAKRFKRPAAPATATATAPGAPKAPRTVGGGATRGFGGVRVGPELFAAPNKDYTAAKADLEGAIDRSNTMDRNLRAAMKGDQQAMISLVSNHIGMTLGGQKGARINQAVWNEAVESAHLDERMIAKSFHRDTNGDYIFDGWKTGVTLTPDQMHQMVGLAHEKVAVLQAHVGRLQRQLRLTPQTTGGDKSLANRLDQALGGK